MVHREGNISPPGANHRSRARTSESSMLSLSKKYPIHSEMIMSTCGGGAGRINCHLAVIKPLAYFGYLENDATSREAGGTRSSYHNEALVTDMGCIFRPPRLQFYSTSCHDHTHTHTHIRTTSIGAISPATHSLLLSLCRRVARLTQTCVPSLRISPSGG